MVCCVPFKFYLSQALRVRSKLLRPETESLAGPLSPAQPPRQVQPLGRVPAPTTISGLRLAPPSPFLKNMPCVRKTEILVEQQPPQGVFVCDHAGPVINKFSLFEQPSLGLKGAYVLRLSASCVGKP